MSLTVSDHFCGAGGSSTGALQVPDVEVVHAANHSNLAVQTHATNYPGIEHTCGDIPSMDPRRYPDTDVLITTPSCAARSYARGRPKDDPHLFKPGDGLDEKSRATMDEVARWADVKMTRGRPYKAIIVENVPQLVDWCEPSESGHWPKKVNGKLKDCNCGTTFRRWLKDITDLGYEHQKVFVNSAFFPPTPQSRDRIYPVFWLRGQPKPDLNFRPLCYCNECEQLCDGIQTLKKHLVMPAPVRKAWGPHDTVYGRYGQQYYYACDICGARAVPAITPAATAIEWDREAVRIGDREDHGLKPLADGTMTRIQRGLDLLPARPFVLPMQYLTDPEGRKLRDVAANVLATLTGQHRDGLVVQVAGNLGRLMADGQVHRGVENSHVHGTERPLKTMHGSVDRAVVIPKEEFGTRMKDADAAPIPTITGSGATNAYVLGIPESGMIVAAGGPTGQQRNASSTNDPLGTILAENHRGLVVGSGGPERQPRGTEDPLPTTLSRECSGIVGLPRLVLSNMAHGRAGVDTDEVMGTVTTGNKLYAIDPWIVPLRRHATPTPAGTDPMPTVVSSGNHHGLLGMIVSNYGGPNSGRKQGWTRDASGNVIGTLVAHDTHAVVEYRGRGHANRVESPLSTMATKEQHALASIATRIEDCTFRMLEPAEIARGMVMHVNAYGDRYVIHGTRRDQVKQLGNACTPPVIAALVGAVKDSLA